MTIPSISPAEAQARLADGAVLVDIRNRAAFNKRDVLAVLAGAY